MSSAFGWAVSNFTLPGTTPSTVLISCSGASTFYLNDVEMVPLPLPLYFPMSTVITPLPSIFLLPLVRTLTLLPSLSSPAVLDHLAPKTSVTACV
jgi:hypothetical protein